jgi:hypothetical protein
MKNSTMATRIVLDVNTGEQMEEEFEFVPPATPPTAGPEVARTRVVELIRSAATVDDLKRALLLHLGELGLRPDGSLELE